MRVEEHLVIPVKAAALWVMVRDPTSYGRFFSGLSLCDHVGGPPVGLGARYTIRLRVGSADIGGLIEVVEFEPEIELAWTSVTGLEQRGRWRLRDHGDGGTRVTLRMIYRAPGNVLGRISDLVAVQQMRGHLRGSLRALSGLAVQAEAVATAPATNGRAASSADVVSRGRRR